MHDHGKTAEQLIQGSNALRTRPAEPKDADALRESNQTLQALIQASPLAIIATDQNDCVKLWNPAATRIFGWSEQEVLGRPNPTIPEHARSNYLALCRLLPHSEGFMEAEESRLRRDGSLVDVRVSRSALYDVDGEVSGVTTMIADNTERRRVEEALRQSEQRLQAVFQSAPFGIVLVDAGDRTLQANPAILRMLGYREEDLLGKPFGCLAHPEDSSGDDELFARLVAGERDHYQVEKRYQRKDGRTMWGRLTTSLIHTPGNPSHHSLLALKMVEELKQPQAVLIQWEKMASIGQLAAGVAHEINNPMGFINSNLNTLGEYVRDLKQYVDKVEDTHRAILGRLGTEVAPHLDEIGRLRKELDLDYVLGDVDKLIAESVEGAQRVKGIVQDLSIFSRADTGARQLADVNSILDSALNIVWNQLKYTCNVVKEYGEVPAVPCNSSQLVQVFVNLLVNAGQAIEKGKQGHIRIRSYVTEDRVHMEVSDNGKGIPRESLKKIFDPFFTTKPVGQGTGLGLSISYSLVKNHGGRIRVSSEVGVGTTFTVELPMNPPLQEKPAEEATQL
ncbi:MAG: PAS domain S-box protein [Chloroflexota bacterium]